MAPARLRTGAAARPSGRTRRAAGLVELGVAIVTADHTAGVSSSATTPRTVVTGIRRPLRRSRTTSAVATAATTHCTMAAGSEYAVPPAPSASPMLMPSALRAAAIGSASWAHSAPLRRAAANAAPMSSASGVNERYASPSAVEEPKRPSPL